MALQPVKMTTRWLDSLDGSDEGEYRDTEESALTLRVSPKGKRTWVCCYTERVAGQRKSRELTLGHYPALGLADARDRAYEARKAADAGQNPALVVPLAKVPASLRPPPPPPPETVAIPPDIRALLGYGPDVVIRPRTVGHLAARYLEFHVRPNRKGRDALKAEARILRTYVLTEGYKTEPAWRDRPVVTWDRPTIASRIDTIAAQGSPGRTTPKACPPTANRVKACCSGMLSHCIDKLGWITAHPILLMKPFKEGRDENGLEKPMRYLSQGEVIAAWDAAIEDEDPVASSAFLLQTFTAQRTSIVLEAEWPEFNLTNPDNAWWTVPPYRKGNKTQRDHRVPILGYALTLLQQLREANFHPRFVFPHRGRGGWRDPGLFETLYDILTRAGRPLKLDAIEQAMRVRGITLAHRKGELRQHLVTELSRRAAQDTPLVMHTPDGWALTTQPFKPVFGDGSLTLETTTWRDFTKRLCTRMHFRPYDSRRTFTTHLGDLDVSLENRKHVLCHKLGDVTSKHYDANKYDKQKRMVMEIWQRELQRWREPAIAAPAHVLSFPSTLT